MKKKYKITCFILLCSAIAVLTACATTSPSAENAQTGSKAEVVLWMDKRNEDSYANLKKLCKVWGYVKYTHPVFLLGEKNWDTELINLIPTVAMAEAEEVNSILYKWFINLGEIDYRTAKEIPLWVAAAEEEKDVQIDMSWIADGEYLGEELSAALQQLQVLPNVDRSKAPVFFEGQIEWLYSNFSNEKSYEQMDYSDPNYRLLGLFRMWNVFEYYFPFRDMMDEDWDDVLSEYIPVMLSGQDKSSYELTIAEAYTKTKDPHVSFTDLSFWTMEWGKYSAPVDLVRAEGQIVVRDVPENYRETCELRPGDVLLKVDGRAIEEIVEERKKYIPVSSDEKIMGRIGPTILMSHDEKMEVTVLREAEEKTVYVRCINGFYEARNSLASSAYKILENNIGVLNVSMVPKYKIDKVMEKLADTDGLVVDLRQYPSYHEMLGALAQYYILDRRTDEIKSVPSIAVPGVFVHVRRTYGPVQGYVTSRYYDKKVVLLIDEKSVSDPEIFSLVLRQGSNVTVMGENSIGAAAYVAYLPLPGGNSIMFGNIAAITAEGEPAQRVGVVPDIYIERTIEGIREERDEFMEAAIEYILAGD